MQHWIESLEVFAGFHFVWVEHFMLLDKTLTSVENIEWNSLTER